MGDTILPHVVGDLAVEAEGALPAFLVADLLDEGKEVGGDGAVTTMTFIIGGATAVGDEATLDAALHLTGHINVETGHTDGHRDGAVVAEEVAGLTRQGIVGVDAGDNVDGSINVMADRPAEALLAEGTFAIETDQVFLCLLAEELFLVLHNVFWFLCAKITINFDFTKNIFQK